MRMIRYFRISPTHQQRWKYSKYSFNGKKRREKSKWRIDFLPSTRLDQINNLSPLDTGEMDTVYSGSSDNALSLNTQHCTACLSLFGGCLNLSCLLVCVCVCVSFPPSVRVGLSLSVWAPPLQLPYFIKGHQLSSVHYCQCQTCVFLLSPPFALSLSLCLFLTHSLKNCPSSSLTLFIHMISHLSLSLTSVLLHFSPPATALHHLLSPYCFLVNFLFPLRFFFLFYCFL